MDYLFLFIIIFIIVLLIIRSNSFGALAINPLTPIHIDDNDEKPKKKIVRDESSNSSKLLKDSEVSLISGVCSAPKDLSGLNINKSKDTYYLNDPKESQLYHVFENAYTFKEAEKTCKDRKGRLATLDELKDSFSKGADWCSWGWASNGHAYMPNRNKKCNKDTGLLSAKNLDPFLRLGANCYGVPH